MIFAANFGEVHSWFRYLDVHVFDPPHDDLRNNQITKPLMVGRNDEPRRVISACLVKHIFKGPGVIAPIVAFLVICVADLPLTIGIIQSLFESL